MSNLVYLTPEQQLLLESNSLINILPWYRRQGSTTGMLMKALTSRGCSLFIGKGRPFENCIELLDKMKIEFEVRNTFNNNKTVIVKPLGIDVTFVDNVKLFECELLYYGANHPNIFIDNVDLLFTNREVTQFLLRRKHHQTYTFSCSPNNRAWRHLEYQYGSVVRDERGKLVVRESSWDSYLIDWDHKNLEKSLATKAQDDYYKPEVKIIY